VPDGSDEDAESPAVREAIDVLYAGPPETFLDTRKDLSAQARSAGDAAAAKAIGALRKPTVAAALVNRHVHRDPDSVDRLLDVGTRLRDAHEALDAAQLRELSTERRALVGELTAAAFAGSGIDPPPAGQRDEVTNTFDAAVADPEIAARLGRLTRSQSWSGFGVAPLSGPALTLVRGGRDAARSASTSRTKAAPGTRAASTKPTPPAQPRPSAAETRKAKRLLDRARAAFDEADAALQEAEQAERTATERIREISTQLSDLQRELEQRKQDRDRSRRAVKAGRAKRREARSALDRAERQAER
jgi:hypothetical protein